MPLQLRESPYKSSVPVIKQLQKFDKKIQCDFSKTSENVKIPSSLNRMWHFMKTLSLFLQSSLTINWMCWIRQYNHQLKMKAVCLTLLLVLSLQLQLTEHSEDSPLAGKNFIIIRNSLRIPKINGIAVSFSQDKVTFHGCNSNWASYTAEEDGSFKIGSEWGSTRKGCRNDRDSDIQGLFNESDSFEFEDGRLTLLNGAQALLTLKERREVRIDED